MLPIVGYTDKLSVAPNESIDVMVGSYGAKTYTAELRKIIQGDTNPDGPGYKDELVDIDLGGERVADHQVITPGSCIVIPDRQILSSLTSMTVAAVIQPTYLSKDYQVILSLPGKLDLYLSPDGNPAVWIKETWSDEQTAASITLNGVIAQDQWTLIAFTYNASTKLATLLSRSLEDNNLAFDQQQSAIIDQDWKLSEVKECVIAASRIEDGSLISFFNGKIDRPSVFDTIIPIDHLLNILADIPRMQEHKNLIASWDFSQKISTRKIVDISPHHLHGETKNAPARAMTGWLWRGQANDWKIRPDLYSAIHFHSSDLYDANWNISFSFDIPDALKSAIYAVKLVPDGDEENAYYCVFAVRPPRAIRSANRVAFLLPTVSYMAYANHRLGLDVPGTEVGMGRVVEIDKHHQFLQQHPEMGYSFYEVHDDSSGVFHSSRLRPMVDMQPKVKGFLGGLGSNIWQFNADTHITGWLDNINQDYDVITDEDIHYDGLALLRQYDVLITGSHPEYYSTEMLNAVQGFTDRGGRLMYLGGNGFYWVVSFSDDMPGIIECRRSETGIRPWEPGCGQFYHGFTGEYGGLWRRNGKPSNKLCGVGMTSQGFDISEPYMLSPSSKDLRVNFMFDGIEGESIGNFGLAGGGAAGLEVDRADEDQGTPPHALVVGSSIRHTDIYLMTPEDLLDPTPDWSGTQSDIIRADLTFLETQSGGAVFSTGSIAWAGAMAWNNYDNDIARLTKNVLTRFNNTEPFNMPDSNQKKEN